jgi:hypothetical protein
MIGDTLAQFVCPALEMLCRGTESGVRERSDEGVLTRRNVRGNAT